MRIKIYSGSDASGSDATLTLFTEVITMRRAMQNLYSSENRVVSWRIAIAITGLLTLSACASSPEAPDQAMQAAELAIASAEQARVADSSSPELAQARVKLAAARAEINNDHMVRAERLANEARVDAELASAKAEVSKARTVNDEMKESTETLKQEMQRNEGVQ